MNKPVRKTIVFALFSGLLVVPAALSMRGILPWPTAFKLAVWADVATYVLLLSRWSGTGARSCAIALSILLGAVVWPPVYGAFLLFAAGALAWIRSGICYAGRPIRALVAEAVTTGGGILLLTLLGGASPVAWALAICLFFLVQSLYFFIVPAPARARQRAAPEDPFERAAEGVHKVLEGLQ